MGKYLNVGNAGFAAVVKSDYVDKTGLISFVNSRLGTKKNLICCSRPRRFGKTYAAKTLCAYYDKSCNSRELFRGLEIEQDSSFEEHLNKHDVIYLDITLFIARAYNSHGSIKDVVSNLQSEVIDEIVCEYPTAERKETLYDTLATVTKSTGNKFIIIIDEWDALFREAKDNTDLQAEYIQLLRGLFKSSLTDNMIEAVYMTGILPIKKYGTQSALTDFKEYTMLHPGALKKYVGFTEEEVRKLCENSVLNFDDIKKWYDGYVLGGTHIYNPKSVLDAIEDECLDDYWTRTETYESLKFYIEMDFDGLKESIIRMLSGESCPVETGSFGNDMTSIKSKDDVLTLLVHLGYLSYNFNDKTVSIPNEEIRQEFLLTFKNGKYKEVVKLITNSDKLLKATLNMDCNKVAELIETAHSAGTSPLFYNNEQALRSVIRLAYISCIDEFTRFEELPSGNGYADMAFLPKNGSDKPVIVIELKWNDSAESAIEQIKNKNYPQVFDGLNNNILLVGINYDKDSKKHTCKIEKYHK